MTVIDLARPTVSFEFFPPKTEEARALLWGSVPDLIALTPAYCTVTSGVGVDNRNGTIAAITRLMDETTVPVAAHVTFINIPRREFFAYADALWELGIRRLVVLRGDMPEGLPWPLDPDQDYFQYTNECVEALKDRHDFDISVGAYPEKHPDAPSLAADIDALRLKCGSGADRALTQFFFDNAAFLDFVEQCRHAGIETPIYPGLLPVYDFKSLKRFATRCEACLPAWLYDMFEDIEDDPVETEKRAVDLLTTQVMELHEAGVEHFHFYTLNRASLLAKVLKDCNFVDGAAAPKREAV